MCSLALPQQSPFVSEWLENPITTDSITTGGIKLGGLVGNDAWSLDVTLSINELVDPLATQVHLTSRLRRSFSFVAVAICCCNPEQGDQRTNRQNRVYVPRGSRPPNQSGANAKAKHEQLPNGISR
jgi:hypothetical protein